ncbi:hypothetical protein ACWD6U_24890, partial [Streptomyces sp. NPDC005149]
GLATAIHAAEAGLEAVVAEPRPTPIDKACGEVERPPHCSVPARAGTLSVCRTMDWTRKPWTYASWSGNRASSYV